MADESINTLRTDLESAKTEIKSLSEKIQKAESFLKALVYVAVIFGISGAWGASVLSTARAQLTDLETDIDKLQDFVDQKKGEIHAEAKVALQAAMEDNDIIARFGKMETRITASGTEEQSVNGPVLGRIAERLVGECPSGFVAKGVRLNLGGTCNRACNDDGRPVAQLGVICVRQ
jgi:hypothetical protein